MIKYTLVSLWCLASFNVSAGPNSAPKPPIIFTDPQIESDYLQLAQELRCLVCQNQNLIDSNAELADDLRREVAKMLKQGKTKQQVSDFMVARYGDFVLYNPPLKPQTYLLWGGPFILMFWGLFMMLKKIKATTNNDTSDSLALSEQEKQQLQNILKK
jgi:cytochrome c-type biogenesis protein CcmH